MAIKRIYNTLEEIPEEHRDLFVEKDGKYVMDLEGGDGDKTADDVRRALAARDHEKQEAAKLRERLEALQGKLEGIDLDRLPDALEALGKVDDLEHQRLLDEKKFEEAAERKFQRQIAEMKRQVEGLQGQIAEGQKKHDALFDDLRKVSIEGQLRKEFIDAGIDPDFLDAAITMEARKWELDPETRVPVPIEELDSGGTKVTAMGSDGKPLTMQEHARTFLRDRSRWALQSSGSNSSHQSSNNGNGRNRFQMTTAEAKDLTKYQQMRAEAVKAGTMVEIVDN